MNEYSLKGIEGKVYAINKIAIISIIIYINTVKQNTHQYNFLLLVEDLLH